MAAMSVVRSGDWTDAVALTTCWTALVGNGPGGTAGLLDTVTHAAAFTVTVPVGAVCEIGTTPQDLVTNVYTTSNNAAKLDIRGHLKLYGNLTMGGGNAGNNHLRIDATTSGLGKLTVMSSLNLVTSRYVLNLGNAGSNNPTKLFVEGVSGARASIVSDSPGVSMYNFTGNLSFYGRHADMNDMTSALSSLDAGGMLTVFACPPTVGNVSFDTDRVKFLRCGQISMGSPPAACTSSIKRTTWENSACGRYNIVTTGSVNNIVTLERVVFDRPMNPTASALRCTHVFHDVGALGDGGLTGSATLTGRYVVTRSEINQASFATSVSGNVKDHVRWFDGRRCRIIGVDPTNDILTLDRAHPYGTDGLSTTQTYNWPDTLPSGLTYDAVNYFVRSVSANQISLYDTSANAIAGGATGRKNITGSTPGGSIARSNPHWSSHSVQEGHIFIFDGLSQDGDCSNGQGTSGTLIMEDNLMIPNPDGGSPGVLISPLTGATERYNINRNGGPSNGPYGLIHIGEAAGYKGNTGMFNQVQANLVYVPTGTPTTAPLHAIFDSEEDTINNKLNAANAYGNWVDGGTAFDSVGEVYDNGGTQSDPAFLLASPPDLVNTPHNLIAKGRSLSEWAAWFSARVNASGDSITTPGTAATPQNARLLCKFMYDGTFSESLAEDGLRLMCEYLRRGQIPTNIAGRAASVGGKTAGPYSAWAPACNSPTASATQGGFTTNCPDGVHAWVITTSITTPDEDRIRAGKDHTGATVAAGFSGTTAITSAGAKTFSYAPTLLPATDYFLHQVHTADDTANGVPGQDAFLRTSEPITSAAFQAAGASSNNGALSLLGVG